MSDPATIAVASKLPQITQGHLTIDASDAGVILDGINLPRGTICEGCPPEVCWIPGLEIVSDGNVIRGLQVINFTGTGIVVAGGHGNTIGGLRNIGLGPIGQGNLTSSNDFGIGLWESASDFASDNFVIGNLVGTDTSSIQALSNSQSGIWISGGGRRNVIGPDNIIAYNGRCGIEVEGTESFGNTLTRNNIYHNGGAGICLVDGANASIRAPYIFSVDLTLGLVSGTSCANCIVEIFSTHQTYGRHPYEGQTVADSNGNFTFNKGIAFTRENITSTATDANGNTSEFSRPAGRVGIEGDTMRLREDNPFPGFLLLPRPSKDLEDNRVGLSFAGVGLWIDIPHLDSIRDTIIDLGAKRVDSLLYEIEPPIDWSGSEFEIPWEFDHFIDELIENDGVAFDYILHFWDKEGHPYGEGLETPRFGTDKQREDFLEYVRYIVDHFRGRVQYYTIWSEPRNCGDGGIKCIETDDYIELARLTIPVIRREDPKAKVVLAPYVLYFDDADVFSILRSDVVKQFDVISWHGLYDVAPNIKFYGDYYYTYPWIIEKIKQTASDNGFRGEYWSTEITWCSEEFPWCHPADQPWGQQETDLLAAKYYARGIVMHLGMDVAVGLGGLQTAAPWSYPTVRNLNTIMAGTTPANLDVVIESGATNVMSYGFTGPDGDKMFALWTDGTAVENDPGVITRLTFGGLDAEKVVGIDVLYGFEQELEADTRSGNIVIRNLLVKDYPIILRFID